MAKMVLGSVTFERNPSEMTVVKKTRPSAAVDTYTSAAFFSWPARIAGQKIELRWPFMSITQWNDHQEQLEADAQLVFNPQNESSKTYNVEMMEFDGKYHITPNVTDGAGHRKEVRMLLLILSEAS